MNATYSLHQISNDSNFGFCPDSYSRFKFGDEAVARKFGSALADGFIAEVLLQTTCNATNCSDIEPLLVYPNGYLCHENMVCLPA
jgi:hypothetical protein